MQQFEKFPADDFVILEPVFQNDSFMNCRAFNKYVGSFAILKYVSLDKNDPQTQVFFEFVNALNENGGDLFVKNLNIYYEEQSDQNSDQMTIVLVMENNVATLKQIIDERMTQNIPYSQEELFGLIHDWTMAFKNIGNPDLRAKAMFNPEAFFLVPSGNASNPDFNVNADISTISFYKISNFDSFLGSNIDPAEPNIIVSMSAFVFQILHTDPEQISSQIFNNYPQLINLLLEMRGGHMDFDSLLYKFNEYAHKFPDESAFWPVNPALPDLTESERVKNFDALVDIYNSLGFYSSAIKPAALNCGYYQEKMPKSPELAKIMNDVGVLLWRTGKHEDAKLYLLESLSLLKELYGENNLSMAICMNNLGLVYEDLNDYDSAMKYLEMSYEMKLGLSEIGKMAIVMNNLASFNDRTGLDEDKAKSFFENALDLKLEVNEFPDQTSVAITLNNLGVFYANRGDFDKALEFLEKEKKYTENLSNENYVISLNNLGYIMARRNQFSDAQNLYISASLILSKQYKMKTQLGASVLANYASLMYLMNNFDAAASMFERSLEIKGQLGGANTLNYAATMNSLGETYIKQLNYEKAVQNFSRSLEIKESIVGLYDKKLLILINNTGYAFLKVNEFHKAYELFNRALIIDESNIATLNNLGLCSGLMGNFNEAVGNYAKALDIVIRTNGENNQEALKISNNLAAIFLKLKDFDKAEENLRISLRIAQTTYPEDFELSVKTKERLDHLIRIKEKSEKSFL